MASRSKDAKRLTERLKSGKAIYGKKKSGRFGKLNAEERAELYIEKGLFDTDDIRKLPKKSLDDLKQALKKRDASLGVKVSYTNSTPEDLFQRYAEQANEFNDREIADKQKHPEKYGLDAAPEYKEFRQVASNDDKWTILRRLAQIDGRLNIDRAYASQTLHEIEDIIEKQDFNIDEITEQMSERLGAIEREVQQWNEVLQDFVDDEEDMLLVNNRGFHGVSKARAHDEASKKGRTRVRGEDKKGHWITDEQYQAFLEFQKRHDPDQNF